MKRICLLAIILINSFVVFAQDYGAYEQRYFIKGNDTLPYRVLRPLQVQKGKHYPMVLLLHGSGERGNDNEKQLVHGADLFLVDSIRERYPAYVIFPQCPESSYWSDVDIDRSKSGAEKFTFTTDGSPTKAMLLLMQLEHELGAQYPIDRKRIYIGGLSMGGMGTFEIVRRMPKTFAAAFPICGGADPRLAKYMKQPSWWIFHGLKDDVVDPGFSKRMEAALKLQKAHVKATYYPEANHNSWDSAFAEPTLLHWMFSKHLP